MKIINTALLLVNLIGCAEIARKAFLVPQAEDAIERLQRSVDKMNENVDRQSKEWAEFLEQLDAVIQEYRDTAIALDKCIRTT